MDRIKFWCLFIVLAPMFLLGWVVGGIISFFEGD